MVWMCDGRRASVFQKKSFFTKNKGSWLCNILPVLFYMEGTSSVYGRPICRACFQRYCMYLMEIYKMIWMYKIKICFVIHYQGSESITNLNDFQIAFCCF